MKPSLPFLLTVAVVFGACGGESAEEGAAPAGAEVASPANADEAALDQVRADYMEHYNMHHAPVVAGLYVDSAVFLAADGSVFDGKAAIQQNLEEAMAGSPTLTLSENDRMLFGDDAVGLGTYQVNTTPPGGVAISPSGYYMTHFVRAGDGWKINLVVTNYDAPPPEGMPPPQMMSETPPDNGTLNDLVAAWTKHFNAGHPDSIAMLYTDDARAAFADRRIAEGRSAIAAALGEDPTPGATITIHDVATMDLGDGHALDGGWYEISAGGSVQQTGTYMLLTRQENGASRIQWHVSNGHAPAPAAM